MRSYLVCVVGLVTCAIVPAAVAATYGPVQDFKEALEYPTDFRIIIEFNTQKQVLKTTPPPPHYEWGVERDSVVIEFPVPFESVINVRGAAWDTLDEPDTGLIHTTTMYGIDLNPMGDDLHMTGFTTAQAAELRFMDERFYGRSGTAYYGVPLGTPTIASLPSLFPGFDLSIFEGDPDSVVYAFRTTRPISDLVPEPSGTLLAALGLSTWLVDARRRNGRRFH